MYKCHIFSIFSQSPEWSLFTGFASEILFPWYPTLFKAAIFKWRFLYFLISSLEYCSWVSDEEGEVDSFLGQGPPVGQPPLSTAGSYFQPSSGGSTAASSDPFSGIQGTNPLHPPSFPRPGLGQHPPRGSQSVPAGFTPPVSNISGPAQFGGAPEFAERFPGPPTSQFGGGFLGKDLSSLSRILPLA